MSELPEGWVETDIGTVGRYINGRGFKESEWRSQGTPIIRIQNLTNEYATFNYSSSQYEHKYRVEDGDLLVAWAATLGVYRWNRGSAWLNQHIFRVEPEDGLITKDFLYYALKQALDGLYAKAHGSGMVHIKRGAFESHPLFLPPLAEQKRIVSKIDELLSSIDEGERALERVRKLMQRYRRSLLKAAVTGELTREWRERHAGELESGEALLTRICGTRRKAWETAEIAKARGKGKRQDIGPWKENYKEPAHCSHDGMPELPTGWVWARAEQLCGPITKGTTPSPGEMTPDEGQVPFIKVYNLTFRTALDFTQQPTFISRVVHEEKLGRSVVLPGDVLMNIVGPPLGKVSIVPQTYPEWNINQAVAVFRPLPGLDSSFLAHYLLSRAAQDWYSDKAKATVGQINLTLEICRDTPIPLPPLAEQAEISQLIAVENSRLDDLEASLSRDEHYSIALRQSVLRSAFSGTLVPQDNSDEPASVLLDRIASERATAASEKFVANETKSRHRFSSGTTKRKAATRKATRRKGKAKA